MKSIENIINEKKVENIFDPKLDVKCYVDCILDRWLQGIQSWNILSIQNDYDKINLLRQCETLIYILDKFSDDICIHFVPLDDETDKNNTIYYGYDLNDRIVSAVNVILKLVEIETINKQTPLKDDESIIDTANDVKEKFINLVKKYNKKYDEYIKEAPMKNNIPSCDCCCKCDCSYIN